MDSAYKNSDQAAGGLSLYYQVYEKFRDDGIIDMDRRLKQKSDFRLFELSEMALAFADGIPPNRQSSYTIGFVRKGAGTMNIGEHSFLIREGTLFVVPARTVSSGRFDDGITSGFLLHFHPDLFAAAGFPKEAALNRRMFEKGARPYRYITHAQLAEIIPIFERMALETAREHGDRQEMLALKVLELILVYDRLFSKVLGRIRPLSYHPAVRQFFALLDSGFKEQRSVQFYADAIHIHPNHLNFLLKKYTGNSAKQYINDKVIAESKQLLSNSTFIIKEIANQMGFDDHNNFSTFFQKFTGVSPVGYRSSYPHILLPDLED